MENSKKLDKKYDHVIVGYNLSSLSFAAKLAERKQSFCILDSKHFGNSPFKTISSVEQRLYTRPPFTPHRHLDQPEEKTGTLGELKIQESSPLTFEKGEFKSFLGFGDTKITGIDAVMPYCQTQKLTCDLTPENFLQKHIENIESQIFLDQKITAIEFANNQVTQLKLNGKQTVQGHQFYFFDHFSFLFEKVSSEAKKLASQFAKAKWFSSVNLIIHHQVEPKNYELEQVYLLKGSKEQPCLGQFSKMNGQLVSRWESFLPSELTADSETTGMSLKEIKKQLKRAFLSGDEGANPEHILILNQVYSDLSKFDFSSGKVSNFSNLEAHSPLFESETGWISEILTGLQAASKAVRAEKSEEAPRIEVAAPHAPC